VIVPASCSWSISREIPLLLIMNSTAAATTIQIRSKKINRGNVNLINGNQASCAYQQSCSIRLPIPLVDNNSQFHPSLVAFNAVSWISQT
jgi:hypothetical protein